MPETRRKDAACIAVINTYRKNTLNVYLPNLGHQCSQCITAHTISLYYFCALVLPLCLCGEMTVVLW